MNLPQIQQALSEEGARKKSREGPRLELQCLVVRCNENRFMSPHFSCTYMYAMHIPLVTESHET